MQLNADFTQRAVVHAAQLDWIPSPTAGVDRRMLDRIGAEVARATSIVRYAPASHFPMHVHHGGEEFLVLEGVFSDEHGDYPAGSYIRNPPTSHHTPGSEQGCTIFVKLWQFDPADRKAVCINANVLELEEAVDRPGVALVPLYQDLVETVRIEYWDQHAVIDLAVAGGMELLVLEGSFSEGDEQYAPQSWLRLPPGATLQAQAGASGCRILLKSGHLAAPRSIPVGA